MTQPSREELLALADELKSWIRSFHGSDPDRSLLTRCEIALRPSSEPSRSAMEAAFANELRKYWSFDDGQQHTHSWHDRENFIERKLPALLNGSAQAPPTSRDRLMREAQLLALEAIARTKFSGSEMGEEYQRGNRDAHETCAGMARAALGIAASSAALPASSGEVREALIETEAKRRCVEADYPLDRKACQDRRFQHDDQRPWWKAAYDYAIRTEIERVEKAGFIVSPAALKSSPSVAVQPVGEWRPIETAPKDGTAIWLLLDGVPFIGQGDTNWQGEKYWIAKAWVEHRAGKPDSIFGTSIPDCKPTHWQPLPAALSAVSSTTRGGEE